MEDQVSLRGFGFGFSPSPQDPLTLSDITFTARPGTLTLVCGGSGSGKSTLLKALSGLIPHFESGRYVGEVRVNGVDPSAVSISSMGLHVASVLQNPHSQFFTTRVNDEVSFAGQNFGWDAARILGLRQQALKRMGICHLGPRALNTLSGGQGQRVACASALAQGAPIYLFDEPTSNLDKQGIDVARGVMEMLKGLGHTVFVAEHRLYYLRDLVDQVLYLQAGKIARRFSGEEFFALSDEERRALGLRSLTLPRLALESGGCPLTVRGATHFGSEQKVTLYAGGSAENASSPSAVSASDLYVENLRVKRGDKLVLDVSGMHFKAGQVTALIGENGVGKSTFARALCGLNRPLRSSRIRLGERQWKRADAYLVMQNTHRQLFASSVRNEAGADKLELLGLAGLEERHPLSLSGGQRQRLVIATALEQDAQVLIFDEPTSGVDYRNLQQIAHLLRQVAAQGKVVIVISHDWELLNACADKAYRLYPCVG